MRRRRRGNGLASGLSYAALAVLVAALLAWGTCRVTVAAFSDGRAGDDPGASSGLYKALLRMGFPLVDVVERSVPGRPGASVARHGDVAGRGWFRLTEWAGAILTVDPGKMIEAATPVFFSAASPRAPEARLVFRGPTSTVLGREAPTRWTETAEVSSRAAPGAPLVLVYHTHAREAYAAFDESDLDGEAPLYSFDPSMTVVSVGSEIVSRLRELGIGALHCDVVHDAAGRIGAYARSEKTVRALLEEHPSIRIVLDVHRDSQPRHITTASIEGRKAARVMVVLGTGATLEHPNWRANLEFAKDFVAQMEDLYPGLSRKIYPKPHRYNQHLSPGALLLEVGGPENTVQEALRSGRMVAEVVGALIASGRIPMEDAAD